MQWLRIGSWCVLSTALLAPARGEEGCCGEAAKRGEQQAQLRQATLAIRGVTASPEKGTESPNFAAVQAELADFGRESAKFVQSVEDDDAAKVRLFGDIATSQGRAKGLALGFAASPDLVTGPTRGDFLSNPGFVKNASALIDEIAAGRVPFVIGGKPDTDNKFPDCVAIGNAQLGYFCSGSLVAPNKVVTAHHCTGAITHIYIGLTAPAAGQTPTSGHVYEVESEKAHPDAPGVDPPHDILVLTLKEDVDPTHAKPRALASEAVCKAAKWGFIVGYGDSQISPIGTSGFGTRRTSPVPLVPGSLSSQQVAAAFGCAFGFEFATGNMEGQASCFGDSGGPVYVWDESAGDWRVAGAVSRALPGDIAGAEVCGWGAVNTLAPKYEDLLQ